MAPAGRGRRGPTGSLASGGRRRWHQRAGDGRQDIRHQAALVAPAGRGRSARAEVAPFDFGTAPPAESPETATR